MLTATDYRFTREDFPTPDLALRRPDGTQPHRAHTFAEEQAQAATVALGILSRQFTDYPSLDSRVRFLRSMHRTLSDTWWAGLARRTDPRHTVGPRPGPERFATPITDADPNYDRLGHVGRRTYKATWDEATRTYTGGIPTPASRILARYGELALLRFELEAPGEDVLFNEVVLPDGAWCVGNRLLRGHAAQAAAQELAARLAARGLPAARVETGGEPIFTATATAADRELMFTAALELLADTEHPQARTNWVRAAYLLYQAPRTKRDSDAVTRVFLAATSVLLTGQVIGLPQDIDLRGYVMGQSAFLINALV